MLLLVGLLIALSTFILWQLKSSIARSASTLKLACWMTVGFLIMYVVVPLLVRVWSWVSLRIYQMIVYAYKFVVQSSSNLLYGYWHMDVFFEHGYWLLCKCTKLIMCIKIPYCIWYMQPCESDKANAALYCITCCAPNITFMDLEYNLQHD